MKAILITSSLLIVLIAALRPLLRGKIDPRVQYALWLAVALRLLIPVNLFTSAYSALALVGRAEEQTHLAQSITQIPIPVRTYQSAHDQALREFEERGETVTHIPPAEIVNNRTWELMKGPTLSELFQRYARPVWLGGAAVMALWFLLVNLRLRRRLRAALPVDADCPLPVRVTPELPSPCLCGGFRPVIYVTPNALADPDRMRHVLAHELTHYRHKDHLWALVRCLCLCVYWFNPLAWWAAAMSRQDCELACDEGAIRTLGEGERIPYGRTLVYMIAAGRNSLLQTATTMTGSKRRVKERVTLIARKPKTVIALALALVLVLGLAVGCTFAGAPEGSPEPNSSPSPTPSLAPDAPRPTLDTLRERLGNIPDLQPKVVNRADLFNDTGVLASYWLDVPADWEDELKPWLLTVYQWDQARMDAEGSFANDTGVSEVFARDGKWYYSIVRPTNLLTDTEFYMAAYQAVRAYAEKTVLDTEGVEPFTPEQSASLQPADTLRERLGNIPEDLRDKVVNHPDKTSVLGTDNVLASYWWDVPVEWENEFMPWLLTVYQWDQARYEQHLHPQGNGGYGAFDEVVVFARDSEYYYVFDQPYPERFELEEAEDFTAAYQAIRAYAIQQVQATEGVVPYSPDPAVSGYTI